MKGKVFGPFGKSNECLEKFVRTLNILVWFKFVLVKFCFKEFDRWTVLSDTFKPKKGAIEKGNLFIQVFLRLCDLPKVKKVLDISSSIYCSNAYLLNLLSSSCRLCDSFKDMNWFCCYRFSLPCWLRSPALLIVVICFVTLFGIYR